MYRIIQKASTYSDSPKTYAALIIGALLAILVFNFVIVPLHNCVKYFFIKRFGDCTAIEDGLCTMRPKPNIHVVGLLTSFLVNIGFANPAYFDTDEFRRPKLYSFIVSLSGVCTYFVSFFLFYFVYAVLKVNNVLGMSSLNFMSENESLMGYIYYTFFVMVYYLALTCIYSAIFNLIPVFPLDMGDALYVHLPLNWQDALRNNEVFVSLGLFIIAFLYLGKTGGLVQVLAKSVSSNYMSVLNQIL